MEKCGVTPPCLQLFISFKKLLFAPEIIKKTFGDNPIEDPSLELF